MGKFYKFTGHLLGLFCASAFTVQALAADKINLPVDRHGFFRVSGETFRYPTTAKIREAVSAANPHVERLPGGGLSQSLPSNIELSATKQTSPISAKVKAGVPALKNGAKNLLKGGLAGIALSEGLQALFDGIDWVIDEGGKIQKIENQLEYPASLPHGDTTNYQSSASTVQIVSRSNPCSPRSGGIVVTCDRPANNNDFRNGYRLWYECSRSRNSHPLTGWSYQDTAAAVSCYYGSTVSEPIPQLSRDVTDAEIDSGVDSNYEPEPDDWNLLARHIDPSDPDVRAEISDIPSLLTPPTTKTIYDANGNPVEVQETNIWYDFDITDNDSKQPAIDIKERKETKTYNEHGELTGTETTTSTSKAASSSSASVSAEFDIPTDCEFMPTVCRFLAWFQEPDPELATEPDLESLRHDLEPERNFEVGSTTAGCPEPITISLAMFPSVEVSLQPLCDFVDLLRPLLLAFASYFATLIVLRSF